MKRGSRRFLEPAALWVAMIAASGSMKTGIMGETWGPLEETQLNDIKAYRAAKKAWDALPPDARGEEPAKPRRLTSSDATPEGLTPILSRQDRGLALMVDELSGFIASMDRYAPTAKAGGANRAYFLQGYQGHSKNVDRKGDGETAIANLLLSICGGIQPEKLRQLGDLTSDGLMQRFIPVLIRMAEIGEEDDTETEAVKSYAALLDRLLLLPPDLLVQLSPEAQAIRRDVEVKVHELVAGNPLGASFASFCAKLHGLWGRLALILHLVGEDDPRKPVSIHTALSASTLIFDYVLKSAARFYVTLGGGVAKLEDHCEIASYIIAKKLKRITRSDLTAGVRVCRNKTVEEVHRQVSPLVAGNWLDPETEINSKAWTVNQQVHEVFGQRAQQEQRRRAEIRRLLLDDCSR